MRVDGREVGVSGSLLQPMPRRTNDILRLVLATVLLALIITSSLITRPRWVAQDIWVGLAVVAAVIALNASRLYLMSLSVDGFVYWHEGAGAQIFAWATTLSVLAISLFGALRVGRAP